MGYRDMKGTDRFPPYQDMLGFTALFLLLQKLMKQSDDLLLIFQDHLQVRLGGLGGMYPRPTLVAAQRF